MKESLFIKLFKYIYGINKPFDEFTNKVISEASNKVAFGLIVFLFVSSVVSTVIGNFYDNSNVAIGLIFADFMAVLIALIYINVVVKRYGLDEYDYGNDSERKRAIRIYFIQNTVTLVFLMMFIVCLNLVLSGDFGVIFFTVYAILNIFSVYLGYRRKFK
ncbi:DUF3278 domain-containing protein [Apilactobacillus kunkeei]|nr:DUF3278 domain-containing protein [Apilactobacillus kunkeei]